MKIWDTAGQERFHTIVRSFLRGSNLVLIVYDTTDYKSFKKIKVWLEEIKELAPKNVKKVIVGNKIDLEGNRMVEYNLAKNFAKENACEYFETSAKKNLNIEEMFECLTADLLKTKKLEIVEEIKKLEDSIELHQQENKPIKNNKCGQCYIL